jgi:hypothetical protein
MGKNGAKDTNFVELAGWEINKVKDGLDETQVVSIINDLISQRDALTQRTEHFASLTKLAERTVTEADRLAEEIKVEAVEQAKTEMANLMAEAEAKARQIEDETQRIKLELTNSVQELFSQLLSGLEDLKQQVTALQAESEQKLAQSLDKDTPVTTEVDNTSAAPQEPAPTISQKDAEEKGTEEKTEPVSATQNQETTADQPNPELELEILPPLDIMKIMEIVSYLDNLPEIENTELIPNTERPSIIVSPREPINLIDILSTMPEIAHLEEDSAETTDEGRPKKIKVRLSEQSVPQEAPKG